MSWNLQPASKCRSDGVSLSGLGSEKTLTSILLALSGFPRLLAWGSRLPCFELPYGQAFMARKCGWLLAMCHTGMKALRDSQSCQQPLECIWRGSFASEALRWDLQPQLPLWSQLSCAQSPVSKFGLQNSMNWLPLTSGLALLLPPSDPFHTVVHTTCSTLPLTSTRKPSATIITTSSRVCPHCTVNSSLFYSKHLIQCLALGRAPLKPGTKELNCQLIVQLLNWEVNGNFF